MTPAEIKAGLREAERDERDALARYDLHPSREARHEVQRAGGSVRWWAMQAAHTAAPSPAE